MSETIQGNPRQGLTGATIGFFIGFAAVALFGPTVSRIKDGLELSPVMVALLVAIPSLTGSLLRIPFAAWVDTTGGRKPFLVLLGLSIIGMTGLTALILWAYPNRLSPGLYPLLLLLGVLCGCGIATFSVGVSQVSYWYPQARQGAALGIYAGLGNLAPGIFTFLLPLALNVFGLGGSYLIWLLLLVGGTGLYYRLGRNAWYFQHLQHGSPPALAVERARSAGQEIFPSGSLVNSLMNSARVWKTWALVGVYFTTFGGFIALTAWLPTYWSVYMGLSPFFSGALAGVYAITASLFRVYGGKLADRLGGENTTFLALLVTLTGSVLMGFSTSVGASIASELLLAAGMGVGNAAVFKLVPQAAPRAVGGVAGWVGGLGAFGGFAIPPLLGMIVRYQGQPGYAYGFFVFSGLAIISFLFTFLLKQASAVKSITAEKEAVS